VKREMRDPEFWDGWWEQDRLADSSYVFPFLEAPLMRYRGQWHDVANRDCLLIAKMVEHGLKTILCAGNGVSQEPRALAEVGFNVTVLDLSPTAIRTAKATGLDVQHFHHFCGRNAVKRSDGHLDFVIGNLLDQNVCHGPFDVIIERRTIQRFPERERPDALEALAARLSKVGILVSHCNDPNYRGTRFHPSQSWFRERNWKAWDGVPGETLTGQVAWLLRSYS
jgi:methyltransferase family protein